MKGQLADTEKRIENLMNAIEQGIITDTTKDRLAQLESKKKEIEIAILQEKIKKPFLTKEQIQFGIERFRNLDITTLEGKRRLIDGFVNSIYLYDDKFTITFNFKDGTQTVFLSEIEATKNSDIKSLGAPKKDQVNDLVFFWYLHKIGTRGEARQNLFCRRSADSTADLTAIDFCCQPCALLKARVPEGAPYATLFE